MRQQGVMVGDIFILVLISAGIGVDMTPTTTQQPCASINGQLKNEISKLITKMEIILAGVQTLNDAKLSLELDVAAYRKLLQEAESPTKPTPPSTTIPTPSSTTTPTPSSTTTTNPSLTNSSVSTKTTNQRTSTGSVAISEVNQDGKFIVLENTSSGLKRRDVNLDGWRLIRNVDGARDYIYPFRNFTLNSGKKVKIFAMGAANEAGLNDLVFREQDSWGVGDNVTTELKYNQETVASHIQITTTSTGVP